MKKWTKKYHFPGCQTGKDDIQFMPVPDSFQCILSDSIGEKITETKLVDRATEIFGADREMDRVMFINAIRLHKRLEVRRKLIDGRPIFIVRPITN